MDVAGRRDFNILPFILKTFIYRWSIVNKKGEREEKRKRVTPRSGCLVTDILYHNKWHEIQIPQILY